MRKSYDIVLWQYNAGIPYSDVLLFKDFEAQESMRETLSWNGWDGYNKKPPAGNYSLVAMVTVVYQLAEPEPDQSDMVFHRLDYRKALKVR